eukprot:11774853-Alexandrium_andersonii.AAC.1
MRAELRRYEVAVIRPDWFVMPGNVRYLFDSRNAEQSGAGRLPWTGAGWDWSHVSEGFVGFDGKQLQRTDVLLPDDLIRMWAFS